MVTVVGERPRRLQINGPTGGVFADVGAAAAFREQMLSPTAVTDQTVAILDLGGLIPTPGALQEMLLPLAQKIKAGVYGPMVLAVSTDDKGIADFIRYMAAHHDLPIFVTTSPHRLSEAQPVGNLTATERESIEALKKMGGQVTASELATNLGIEATAAGNRLVGLAKKGYVYRIERPRREGDLFIDPRRGDNAASSP